MISGKMEVAASSMMQVKCKCGMTLTVPENIQGKKGKCPKCGRMIEIGKKQLPAEFSTCNICGQQVKTQFLDSHQDQCLQKFGLKSSGNHAEPEQKNFSILWVMLFVMVIGIVFLSSWKQEKKSDEMLKAKEAERQQKLAEAAERQQKLAEAAERQQELAKAEAKLRVETEAEAKRRYSVSVAGVITDSKSQLQWYIGMDQEMTWDESKEWINRLTVEGHGWRMPSIDELLTLYQMRMRSHYMARLFHTEGQWLWSGEISGSTARCFSLHNGSVDSVNCGNSNTHVFAVRASQQELAEAKRLANAEAKHLADAEVKRLADVIAKIKTEQYSESKEVSGAMWAKGHVQKLAEALAKWQQTKQRQQELAEAAKWFVTSADARYKKSDIGVIWDIDTDLDWYVGPNENTTWDAAQSWINGLTVDGGNWRMPNMYELQGIYQQGRGGLYHGDGGAYYMDPVFVTSGCRVWSGEVSDSTKRLFVFSRHDILSTRGIPFRDRVFAVRGHAYPASQYSVVAASQYSVSADGVITDSKSGLQWYIGPDKDMCWDRVKTWVDSLTVDGGGWRMPTIEDLQGLYQKGKGRNNMDTAFVITGLQVWSGSGVTKCCARIFIFDRGRSSLVLRSDSKSLRGFAVRGQTWSKISSDGRYKKSSDSVILDTKTNLEWLVGPDKDITWDAAKSWTDALMVDGGCWRMPTISELRTIYQNDESMRHMDSIFVTTGLYVWSCQINPEWRGFYRVVGGNTLSLKFDYPREVRAFAVRGRRI